MFAHVSPEGDPFGETISTLKSAQRVSTVELGAARVNKASSEIMQLKEQILTLGVQVENHRTEMVSKQPRSPREKPKAAMSEQTPPCVGRLSIENSSNINSQTVNLTDRKGSKTPVAIRSRRLSLKGPRYSKIRL